MADEMNGYKLSKWWHLFAFENPDLIKPHHGALYFYIVDQANRFGWKQKFGLPTRLAMETIGIRSYNTYIKTLNDLIEFEAIIMVKKSFNQHHANIISLTTALSKYDKAEYKALDKASQLDYQNMTEQVQSTTQSMDESTDSIIKQVNNKPEINMDFPRYEDQSDLIKQAYTQDEFRIAFASNKIAEFFSISKFKQSGKFEDIKSFVKYFFDQGRLEELSKQFTAYKAIKSKSPEFKHSLSKYLGSKKARYEDGAWNEKDWQKELESLEETQTVKATKPVVKDTKSFS